MEEQSGQCPYCVLCMGVIGYWELITRLPCQSTTLPPLPCPACHSAIPPIPCQPVTSLLPCNSHRFPFLPLPITVLSPSPLLVNISPSLPLDYACPLPLPLDDPCHSHHRFFTTLATIIKGGTGGKGPTFTSSNSLPFFFTF